LESVIAQEADTPRSVRGDRTHAGTVIGTPGYMAPEQARGEVDRLDERTDVFGLGALLCEILTGQPPFPGLTFQALQRARSADLGDAFTRLNQCGAEAELVTLAKRCLAEQPEQRFRHAGELAAALTAYLEGVPPSSSSVARARSQSPGRESAAVRGRGSGTG